MQSRETPGGPNQGRGYPEDRGPRVFERGLSPRTDGEGGYPEGTEGLGFSNDNETALSLSLSLSRVHKRMQTQSGRGEMAPGSPPRDETSKEMDHRPT